MLGAHAQCDSATRGKLRGNGRSPRRTRFHKIVENTIGDGFVEGALVTIRRQIKLKRFAFDAQTVGDVIDLNSGEIGLTGYRTKTGEIVGFEMNVIIPARGIWKGFQTRFGRSGRQFCLASAQQSEFCAFGICPLHRLNVQR